MELRQLRYFLAVAEELNFTRAAERVGIAQPPLSMQISGLEHELGVDLFTRNKRRVALTPAGETLVPYAKRVINTTLEAADVVKAVSRGDMGSLSVGAIFSTIYTLVPHALRTFAATHPRVEVRLHEMTIPQQLEALRDGSIDLGILRGQPKDPDLESVRLLIEPFVVVLPADHHLAAKSRLTLEDVAREPIIGISPPANPDYSARMVGMFQKGDYRLNIVQEVRDTHTIIGLVGAGIGISMVPASLQGIQIRQVVYRPLVDATPTTEVRLAWRKDAASRAIAPFVAAAQLAVEPEAESEQGEG